MARIDVARVAESLAPQNDAPSDRPESAVLVELIEHIDAAIARGVPRTVILQKLHEGGFTMSLPTFVKALQRIRKRLGRPAPRHSQSRKDSIATTPAAKPERPSPTVPAASIPNAATRQSEPPGFKSIEQLQAENPTLPSIQITKIYAQQYDRASVTGDQIDELKRKYGPTSATA